MIFNFVIFLSTLIAMEGVGFVAHKYVMHGWGWFLHRSHHEEHLGPFEANDLYLLALALVAVGLIVLGNDGHDPLQWVGAGIAAFGLIYMLVHDGLVHRNWPFKPAPGSPYLRRLYEAHVMHHRVKGRRNSVSFGFLYAPPVEVLHRQLRDRQQGGHPSASAPYTNEPREVAKAGDLQRGSS